MDRGQLSQLENEMTEGPDPKAQKYQELFAKDKEMSELIDTFEDKRDAEQKKIETSQEKIVSLLQVMGSQSCSD